MLIIDCISLMQKELVGKTFLRKNIHLVPLSYCVMPLAAVWLVSMQLGPFSHYLTAICHQCISLSGVDFTATTLCKLHSAETGKWRKGERRGGKVGRHFLFFIFCLGGEETW